MHALSSASAIVGDVSYFLSKFFDFLIVNLPDFLLALCGFLSKLFDCLLVDLCNFLSELLTSLAENSSKLLFFCVASYASWLQRVNVLSIVCAGTLSFCGLLCPPTLTFFRPFVNFLNVLRLLTPNLSHIT